ncbi:transcription initiation factor IIB [Atractiella rhizophila]|nr:transcription initiation factor IIB [Atractiella rhizophila]
MAMSMPFPARNPNTQTDEESAPAPSNSTKVVPQDLAVRLICPDCNRNPPNLVEEYGSGDVVCADCGLVVGDKIVDTRSEWRTFANDEGDDPSRVGGPSNPFLSTADDFSTVISFRDNHTGTARDLQRASQRAAQKGGEKNLANAFRDISNMCDLIQLGRTEVETAKQIYKRVEDLKLLRGKPMEAVIAACVFVACRQGKVPRTFKEICAVTKVKKKTMGQCFKALEESLQLYGDGSTAYTGSKGHTAEDLLPRFCSHLGLMVAREVILRAQAKGILAGRSPISVAAAAIYFGGHLIGLGLETTDAKGRKTKRVDGMRLKKIADETGVSDVTIRNAFKFLKEQKEDVVDPKWFEESSRVKANFDWLPAA